ncbi:hypothetical protein LTR85_005759 [Meristemomyces frigidus]|nr:hypothetical protein LTR85_005759 [Meristemomyces frigidus]
MQQYYSGYSGPTGSDSWSADRGIPITAVLNENWQGKNDPHERRRIQNRLNQRAFRQRQRAGDSPKQYRPRSMSGPASQESELEDDFDGSSQSTDDSLPYRLNTPVRAVSAPAADQPSGDVDTRFGLVQVWDELARTINRNTMAAAATNAQHLGIDMNALRTGTPMLTTRRNDRSAPAALAPIELQYRVLHDPIIDTIPHARLRYNILRAIAAGQLSTIAPSMCYRGSGTLQQIDGSWQRGGLVVWSFPEQLASWELTELFVRQWGALLQGCEDLIAVTNAWRSRRGEKLFPQSIERSDVLMWY